jgi:GxxExxY protein
MKHTEITSSIIECAYKVHKELGFGFLESVYQNALMVELAEKGLQAEKEKRVAISYKGHMVGDYVSDVVVDDKVILELKSTKELHASQEAQLVNYLKATGIEVGLLINFGNYSPCSM